MRAGLAESLWINPHCLSDIRSSVYNRIKQEQLVMQCSIMAFCTPLLQEAAYEVWLKSQKKALHLKCVSYLEGQAHKCRRCGEGDFISFHRHTVEMILVNTGSQEDISEQHKEYPFSEAASLIIKTTLKNLQAPSFEGKWKPRFLLGSLRDRAAGRGQNLTGRALLTAAETRAMQTMHSPQRICMGMY